MSEGAAWGPRDARGGGSGGRGGRAPAGQAVVTRLLGTSDTQGGGQLHSQQNPRLPRRCRPWSPLRHAGHFMRITDTTRPQSIGDVTRKQPCAAGSGRDRRSPGNGKRSSGRRPHTGVPPTGPHGRPAPEPAPGSTAGVEPAWPRDSRPRRDGPWGLGLRRGPQFAQNGSVQLRKGAPRPPPGTVSRGPRPQSALGDPHTRADGRCDTRGVGLVPHFPAHPPPPTAGPQG